VLSAHVPNADATGRSTVSQSVFNDRAIHHATSRRAVNSRRAHHPSTTMKTANASSSRASISTSRSPALILRPSSESFPCLSTLYLPSFHRPFARGGADGSQCLPCVRHPALLRSSTRALCPSDGRLFHPCSQSRAAWPDPSTQIRDLPWPRLPPPVPGAALVSNSR